MRSCIRAIVIKDGNLLVMHRNKFGEEYRTLIGGGIEENESPIAALHREVGEETQLIVSNPRLVFVERNTGLFGDQYIFLCDYVSGEPALDPRSSEAHASKHSGNTYQPVWMPLTDINRYPFRSEKVKECIMESLHVGWPDEPIEFN